MTTEAIIVLSVCVIAAFMFGLVAGISIEYHTSKREMQRQQANEAKRLQGLVEATQEGQAL